MATRKEIFAKPERCTRLHELRHRCGVEHSQGKKPVRACTEKPAPRSRVYVEWSAPSEDADSLRHCDDAPCMHACIVRGDHAGRRRVVTTDTDRCIGCWTASWSAPTASSAGTPS